MDEVLNMYPNLGDQTDFRLNRINKPNTILLLKLVKEN